MRPLRILCLHGYHGSGGRSDGVVPPRDSRELAARFGGPTVLEHGGGHVIASDPSIRSGVDSFLQEMARRR